MVSIRECSIGESFDGIVLWCARSHRSLVLMSTQKMNKGKTLDLVVCAGVAFFLAPRTLRSGSEVGLLLPLCLSPRRLHVELRCFPGWIEQLWLASSRRLWV